MLESLLCRGNANGLERFSNREDGEAVRGTLGQAAQREAVAALNGADPEGERAQNRAQSQPAQNGQGPM